MVTNNILIVCKPRKAAERSSGSHKEHDETLEKIKAWKKTQPCGSVSIATLAEAHRGFLEAAGKPCYDLVVAVGGDGTLLAVSHFVGDDIPVLLINSAPSYSEGYFAGGDLSNVTELLDDWQSFVVDALERPKIARMRISLNGHVLTSRALNDALFCHSNPAMTSRYSLQTPGQDAEAQMSSGVWFCTAAGSTAAVRSAGGFTMPHDNKNLQYLVREPFQPRRKRIHNVHGFVRPTEKIEITSGIKDGAIYIDGSYITNAVYEGDKLVIEASDRPLTLVNFRKK